MNKGEAAPIRGGCSCGGFSFDADRAPITRFICHCLFCQDFTGQAFSDVAVFKARHLRTRGADALDWQKYRGPPNLRRGRCRQCGNPALETMGFRPFKLLFIPFASVADPSRLPSPKLHAFYDRRVVDADDRVPKYSYYWPSEIAITKSIMGL
jgi:hypothetical protein